MIVSITYRNLRGIADKWSGGLKIVLLEVVTCNEVTDVEVLMLSIKNVSTWATSTQVSFCS